MKRKMILIAFVLIVFVLIAFTVRITSASPADAAPSTTGYTIDWYTIDGGGAMNLTGGSYTLSGTIGQPDAGLMSGGNYKLDGGFWGFLDSLRKVFLPLVVR